ncbi:hypothetical protein V5O48_001675 [Marasmius crinis-equi]|uniref:Uncharacterized protein n=1 Tax=Marasmius crinis-equi TaxID=585013 RepID=A0ABR3FXR4_9AGAR
MSALDDCISRLNASTKSIASITSAITQVSPGPFTRALLFTELGDLIRDIDPSELGLFSVSNSSPEDVRAPSTPEISRVDFHGATPLRKPTLRKEEQHKSKEVLPEVFARAALNQYVRPMPRAHSQVSAILEQLEAVRERIYALSETLKQTEAAEAPSLTSSVEEEERRIEILRLKRADYEKRKEALSAQKHSRNPIQETPKPPTRRHRLSSPFKRSTVDLDEETFWTTSPSHTRTPRFTENLLDEEAEFGDQSILSLASPAPRLISSIVPVAFGRSVEEEIPRTPSPVVNSSLLDHVSTSLTEAAFQSNDLESPGPQAPDEAMMKPSEEAEVTPTQTPGTKKAKIRINVEVERTVAKIWASGALGDIALPEGHTALEAKATIARLQSLSSMTPSPSSPTTSVSSASGGAPIQPSPQQILTAHLLLALLSTPQLSLPLNKVKELLSAKANTSGSAALVSSHMKPYFTCLSKRLLKVDRASGEQVVKFNL